MFKRSLTRTLVLISSLTVLTACSDNSENEEAQAGTKISEVTTVSSKEVPFAERPIASDSERDQLILDLSNFYLESMVDLVSHYDANKKRDPSIFINWRKNEWFPGYTERMEQLYARVNKYQIGAVDRDFSPVRSAVGHLGLVSVLFVRSLRSNDPLPLQEAKLQLAKGMNGILETTRSRNLEGRLIIPEALKQRIPQ